MQRARGGHPVSLGAILLVTATVDLTNDTDGYVIAGARAEPTPTPRRAVSWATAGHEMPACLVCCQ